MGRLEAFALPGFSLWFNSHDHLPPHFHAESDQGEARVFFLREPPELELKWGTLPRAKARAALLAHACGFRLQLLEEWEAKVVVAGPGGEK